MFFSVSNLFTLVRKNILLQKVTYPKLTTRIRYLFAFARIKGLAILRLGWQFHVRDAEKVRLPFEPDSERFALSLHKNEPSRKIGSRAVDPSESQNSQSLELAAFR